MKCPAGKCECVHLREDTNIGPNCSIVGAWVSVDYEQCPCPSKIQAPKKDPLEECAKEIHKLANYPTGVIRKILREHNLTPKGDVDKAWEKVLEVGSSILDGCTEIDKRDFISALKAGDFEL